MSANTNLTNKEEINSHNKGEEIPKNKNQTCDLMVTITIKLKHHWLSLLILFFKEYTLCWSLMYEPALL